MTELADALDAPELARTWAARIAAVHIDLSIDSADWAIVAACRIYADVREALAAVPVLAAISARHTPRRWNDASEVVVCDSCSAAWPCETAEILAGHA